MEEKRMRTVRLATLDNIMQAQMLCDLLENEGIMATQRNGAMATVLNTPGFQVEVEVDEQDYERALQCLREAFPYLGY